MQESVSQIESFNECSRSNLWCFSLTGTKLGSYKTEVILYSQTYDLPSPYDCRLMIIWYANIRQGSQWRVLFLLVIFQQIFNITKQMWWVPIDNRNVFSTFVSFQDKRINVLEEKVKLLSKLRGKFCFYLLVFIC